MRRTGSQQLRPGSLATGARTHMIRNPFQRLQTALVLRMWGRDDERGANLVEYALLLALIVLVCVGAVMFFGQAPAKPINTLGDELSK
jgi:pilus assembly protein Flp/PilA